MKRQNIVRIVLATALILLIPLVAMQFSDEVDWGWDDFVLIGALLLGAGFMYEFVSKKLKSTKQRIMFGAFLVVALSLIHI